MGLITEFGRAILVFLAVSVLLTSLSLIPAQDSVVGKKIDFFFQGEKSLGQKLMIMGRRILAGDFGQTQNGNSIFRDTVNSYFLSMELILISGFIALLSSVILALYAARYQDYLIIRTLNVLTFCFCNIPYFLTAIVFIFIFSIMFQKWFGFSLPVTGMRDMKDSGFSLASHLRHLVLPVSIITMIMFSQMYSFFRIQAETIWKKHFIKFSCALGIPEHIILFKYVLKNLADDIMKNLVDIFQTMIGVIVIIEIIFSWPGIGFNAYNSVRNLNVGGLFCALLLITTTVVVLQFVMQLIRWSGPLRSR